MQNHSSDIFGNAVWIQGDPKWEAPLFRKSFLVPDPAEAALRICGLGFFQGMLNGLPITEDRLVPGWSNYEERHFRDLRYPLRDTFHNRIYYMEYDVTSLLRPGGNILAVQLGNGWYNDYSYTAEGDMVYGLPKLCFQLSVRRRNGTTFLVVSDESLLTSESEILRNNIHIGEVHDLRRRDDGWTRLEFDDGDWKRASAVPAPNAEFCRQDFPADRVARVLTPKLIRKDAGRSVYDCGENITGYPVLRLPASEGNETAVRHSEEFDPVAGVLDFSSTGSKKQIQEDRYICGGREFLCHPQFTWHGFRYFEVTGKAPAPVERVEVLHADVPVIASFESSNETLNWLFKAYLRSQLGNLHCGVPSDCPHRERLGYTGDGQVTCRAAMFSLNMKQIYRKWMRDIVDGQDLNTGHVQHTAPFAGGGGGPGGWGGAVFILPWQFYLHYGDASLLEQYFPNILLWLDYMEHCCENGLVVHEEEGGWCLGDWCAPNMTIPEPFVNTYYYVKGLETALRAGKLLDRAMDYGELQRRAHSARAAITAAYFDPAVGSFCGGANGADAFAVDLGLGDSRTLSCLIARYSDSGSLDTGIFGTDLLIDILFQKGCGSLAYQLLTSASAASFYHMRQAGATTLWEDWEGKKSHNHPMFGGVAYSLFTYLLGIRQPKDSCGFRELMIQPVDIPELEWVKGSVRLGDSLVEVSVHKDSSGKRRVESKRFRV